MSRLTSVVRVGLGILRHLWPAYVLASILILYGFGWGLPDNQYQNLSFHADENAIVGGIRGMQFPRLYPGFFAWGTAVFYQVWAIQGIVTLHHLVQLPGDALYLIGRATVYVYALGTLTLTFVLGRRLFGDATGRMAATTLAVMPGFVQSSHYFKTDVPTTFWLVAALLAAYQTLTSRRALYVGLLGLLLGYAASTKYTSIVVFPVGLAAIWMARPLALSFPRAVLLYLAAVGVGFLVGTPYAVLRPQEIINAALDHADLSATVANSASPIGAPAWLDYIIRVLPLSATLTLAMLAAAGLLWSLLRFDRRLLLVWAFVICYFGYLSVDNYRMVRYTVPLLPFVALFIAYLGSCLNRAKLTRVLGSIGGIAVIGYAFLFSFSYVQVMAEVDPRIQASQWIATHIPTTEPVLVEDTSPTDSPRFDTFGYTSIQVDYRADRVRHATGSSYLLVSEYATRPFGRVTTATDAEEQAFWSLVATDFVEVARFENSQRLLWLDSKKDPASITHDWLQPNPRITLYQRVGG
ncbi:MAG: ArnT family glycosyltransferase [Chloroflexota bacterium]